MVIGLLAIAAIPTVTGVGNATSAQKRENEASGKKREKFNLTTEFYSEIPEDVEFQNPQYVILKHGRLYLENGKVGLKGHRFSGYYFPYPPASPPHDGLVSTIAEDPPMLNWIFVDSKTLQVRHGSKTDSLGHITGPWQWTEDEENVTLKDDEGFVVVEEGEEGSGVWGVYYDVEGDGEGLPVGRRRVDVSLRRLKGGVGSKYVRE